MKRAHPRFDVAVVGAGAAGLYTALVAAEAGAAAVLISSAPLAQSASYRAQGGLAAALARDDSPEHHLADTLAAGRGACRPSAARILCAEAPARARELSKRGVPFDTDADGELALGLEGGHSRRRVVHAGGSATGRRVTDTLSRAVIANDRIDVWERASALALWVEAGRCVGVVTSAGPLESAATVMATGGAGALWQRTTNPPGAIGAGLLLAWEAGATLADLELLQFHPTALVSPGGMDGFLVTEAVRGEGARLLTAAGHSFVDELAPRDEVALAIREELAASGRDAVLLDMTAVDLARFPNIAAALAEAGLDPEREPVPVAPAAHYTIGGIATDGEGRSTLPGLFAAGECACTGIHGANRLASNSLSECFVLGRRAGLAAARERGSPPRGEPPEPVEQRPPSAETRAALWEQAGLVRRREGLELLLDDLFPLARLVASAALLRVESRGCHRRADAPAEDPALEGRHLLFEGGAEQARIVRWD